MDSSDSTGRQEALRFYVRHIWIDGARSEVTTDPAAPFFVAEELRGLCLLLAELPGAQYTMPGLRVVVCEAGRAWRLELAADARSATPPTLTIQTNPGTNAERVAVLQPWRLSLALAPPLPGVARDFAQQLARLACIQQPPPGAAPKRYKFFTRRAPAVITPSHDASNPKEGGAVTAIHRANAADHPQTRDDPK